MIRKEETHILTASGLKKALRTSRITFYAVESYDTLFSGELSKSRAIKRAITHSGKRNKEVTLYAAISKTTTAKGEASTTTEEEQLLGYATAGGFTAMSEV